MVTEKVAKFFVYVVRRNCLETLEGTVGGKSERSPTKYLDLITVLTDKDLIQIFKMAQNKQKWKTKTEN